MFHALLVDAHPAPGHPAPVLFCRYCLSWLRGGHRDYSWPKTAYGHCRKQGLQEARELTDFGLARAVDDAGLTRTGELAGTPGFMSPEQAGNEAVDHRSDLFSFGTVLYAMCTGVSPFRASSVMAAVRKVCDARPPPVHEINPAIPRWLSDIIARLMAKDRRSVFNRRGKSVSCWSNIWRGCSELGELRGGSRQNRAKVLIQRRVMVGATVGLAGAGLLFFALKNPHAVPSNSLPPPSLQEHRETKALPSVRIREPFLVKTEAGTIVGGFARMEDALAAAPIGGVIELWWTERPWNAISGRVSAPTSKTPVRSQPGNPTGFAPPHSREEFPTFPERFFAQEGYLFPERQTKPVRDEDKPGSLGRPTRNNENQNHKFCRSRTERR